MGPNALFTLPKPPPLATAGPVSALAPSAASVQQGVLQPPGNQHSPASPSRRRLRRAGAGLLPQVSMGEQDPQDWGPVRPRGAAVSTPDLFLLVEPPPQETAAAGWARFPVRVFLPCGLHPQCSHGSHDHSGLAATFSLGLTPEGLVMDPEWRPKPGCKVSK